MVELYNCDGKILNDVHKVETIMVDAAKHAHARIVDVVFHTFNPHGISGVIVIAESHLAIHIWPENRYAAVDVFTCGENVRMDVASAYLEREFRARHAVQRRFSRGERATPRAKASKPRRSGLKLAAAPDNR